MKSEKAWALLAYFRDGSGIPEVLCVSTDKNYLTALNEIVSRTEPMKVCGVVDTVFFSSYQD